MLVPSRSAGMRSGVNWMRRKRVPSKRDRVSARSVLPVPGTPSSSACPPASRQTRSCSLTDSCPMMTRSSPWLRSRHLSATSLTLCILQSPEGLVDRAERLVEALAGELLVLDRDIPVEEGLRPFLQGFSPQAGLHGHGVDEAFIE